MEHNPNPITPGVLSMLPLFYIGWSDSVLSPSEVKLIHERLSELSFLTQDEKEYLIKYNDPKNPPGPEVFKQWVTTMKNYAHILTPGDKKTLAEMGSAMAISGNPSDENVHWSAPKTKMAIMAVQKAMGLENDTSVRIFLSKVHGENIQGTSSYSYSFEPKKLYSALHGDKVEAIDRVKKLLQDPFFKILDHNNLDDKRQWTLQMIQSLADQGMGAYAFPKEYGGLEMPGNHITVFETLAYYDLSTSFKQSY